MVFKRHSHCTLKEQPVNKTEWIQIAHWRWRINLKWWSVVDVPPWWHLVSQVLLAFLILGLWGGAGRDCCSVKVCYCSHNVSCHQLRPRMASGLAQKASLELSYHLPLALPSVFTFPPCRLSASPFLSLCWENESQNTLTPPLISLLNSEQQGCI